MSAGNTFEVTFLKSLLRVDIFGQKFEFLSSKSTYTVVYNKLTVLHTLDWSYLHTYKKTTYTDRRNKMKIHTQRWSSQQM
jgi:hypothetical protein